MQERGRIMTFNINKTKCINCGLCSSICMVYEKQENETTIKYPNLCIKCGHCEAICPVNAIIGPEPVTLFEENSQKISADQLQMLIKTRRSVRKYKNDKVKDEDLARIFEAARFSPTGANAQDIKYIVINDCDKIQELRKISIPIISRLFKMARFIASLPFSYLILGRKQGNKLKNVYGEAVGLFIEQNNNGYDRLFYNSPGLLIVYGEKQDEALAFSSHIALHNAALMAHCLNIGTLLNSFFLMALNNSKVLRKKLDIPNDCKAFGVMTFGYQNIKYKNFVNRNPVDVRYY